MSIAPAVLKHYPELAESQRAVIGHLDGPLLVIAGPGSGKTHCIVLRALNLLLLQKAEPGEIVLCTFTEKAAFEMRDRLSAAARKVGYKGDLSELTTSTIHGFCNRVLTRHRHRTKLGHSYETLDELTQLLFILEHFDEIVGPPDDDLFLARWKTRWTAIEGARGYFDKITEELVDPCRLIASGDPFIAAVGAAYRRYEQALLAANRVDFAHLQRFVVAFSRPQKVLVLTAHERPRDHFASIWQGLPQWPYVRKELLAAQCFEPQERMPVKKTYSFTGDLRIYETCPRQYRLFRLYDFTPSRSAVIFFGLLVHQSIEEVHRIALDGRLHSLDETRIRALFERTFRFLCLSDVRPIGDRAKESAFTQVMNYFRQNQGEMSRVVETEVDVSLEKDDYILAGKVDLLLGGDGKLELLDFKTSPRPRNSPGLIAAYERQLCTYAHILERRHGRHVDRLLLYWTSEARKEDALMVLPYRPEQVDEAGRHFDATVGRIRAGEFSVTNPPEAAICRECDLRTLCRAEGVIGEIGDSEALAA